MSNHLSLSFKSQIKLIIMISMLLAIIEITNLITNRSLNANGLIPRNSSGLMGILFSPFLHGSLTHFFSNIIPFIIFSFFLLQHGIRKYLQVTFICIAASGLLVWCFARDAIHVGASGLIYGYFGYLVLAGFISKRFKLILISLFIGITYGTLVFGVLPTQSYVSWESHLFGLLTGLICAYYLNRTI